MYVYTQLPLNQQNESNAVNLLWYSRNRLIRQRCLSGDPRKLYTVMAGSQFLYETTLSITPYIYLRACTQLFGRTTVTAEHKTVCETTNIRRHSPTSTNEKFVRNVLLKAKLSLLYNTCQCFCNKVHLCVYHCQFNQLYVHSLFKSKKTRCTLAVQPYELQQVKAVTLFLTTVSTKREKTKMKGMSSQNCRQALFLEDRVLTDDYWTAAKFPCLGERTDPQQYYLSMRGYTRCPEHSDSSPHCLTDAGILMTAVTDYGNPKKRSK
ncbi:hypothetical protein BaRGS_00030905 [Batillaria attramentaria]|uniref:Uncharacterized protein n=1 Tax=Batillaria attramentaria TaxID=370345 RepID=A0ABD0JTC2_9CAEN